MRHFLAIPSHGCYFLRFARNHTPRGYAVLDALRALTMERYASPATFHQKPTRSLEFLALHSFQKLNNGGAAHALGRHENRLATV